MIKTKKARDWFFANKKKPISIKPMGMKKSLPKLPKLGSIGRSMGKV